ncbi:MAG: SAF domain-containing protein [Solirubrobacterales bacterium]
MNRRNRAIMFSGMAIGAALLAVSLVRGYSASVVDSYGTMRPVTVVTREIPGGREITPEIARSGFEVRQVPARFAPAGIVPGAGSAIGLKTAGPLFEGSYLTTNMLKNADTGKRKRPEPGRGRHAVEIAVTGAGALAGTTGQVDVLVTTEPGAGGSGRTYIAASHVPLLGIGQTGASDAGIGLTQVTLGLTRRQAIELIEAESFARKVTILPGKT